MLTESQAKAKWCPFTRVVAGTNLLPEDRGRPAIAGVNRDIVGQPIGGCIASQCMAWRAMPEYEVHHHVNATRKPEIDKPSGDGWTLHPEQRGQNAYWTRQKPGTTPRGFCGLAGQVTP